jgi:hypothetical protein
MVTKSKHFTSTFVKILVSRVLMYIYLYLFLGIYLKQLHTVACFRILQHVILFLCCIQSIVLSSLLIN